MPHGEEGLKATCWSAMEAAEKPKPVTTPVGSVATSKRKLSYHPRLLLHPMSAKPANHPSPRRLASRTGIAELSRAWYGHLWAFITSARCKAISSMRPRLWRTSRLNWELASPGKVGKASLRRALA
jgi:hypothetical protein